MVPYANKHHFIIKGHIYCWNCTSFVQHCNIISTISCTSIIDNECVWKKEAHYWFPLCHVYDVFRHSKRILLRHTTGHTLVTIICIPSQFLSCYRPISMRFFVLFHVLCTVRSSHHREKYERKHGA